MKNLAEIAEVIYTKSQKLALKETSNWDSDIFTKKWFNTQFGSSLWDNTEGWYWISCNITNEVIGEQKTPIDLPVKACVFKKMYVENSASFNNLLCKPYGNDLVIYNGHAQNVLTRLRTHFALKNNKTGALGVNHYPLSNREWQVSFFTKQCLVDVKEDDVKNQIIELMKSKPGRCAIENSWRAINGWPILCKA